MSKTIYTIEDSDIPGLYHVGFQGIAGRHFNVNKRDYYKVVPSFSVAVPPIHQDTRTGIFYQYQNKTQMERWKYQYSIIKPDIDVAIKTKNIIPITNDEEEIIKNLSVITNKEKIHELEDKLKKENLDAFKEGRREQLGQVFGKVVDISQEPLNKTTELLKKSIGDVSENASKLAGSPSFLILLAVGGIIALKVIL